MFCRSEELHNFLISVRQQCCYLTETIQDVISRFPRQASQVNVICSGALVQGTSQVLMAFAASLF